MSVYKEEAGAHVAVIIPVLNEAEVIGKVIAEIPSGCVHRIIVADGGSLDATEEQAEASGAEVIHVGRGYGRACFTAAMVAEEFDILVFMDGDGADNPAAIPDLIGPIVSGRYDFVIGSRLRGQWESNSLLWHQRLAAWMAGTVIRLRYGVTYTDMCAFRAIRRDVLLDLGMIEMTYGWNIEMQIRVARRGLRILEVPINNRLRLGGASKVSGTLKGSLKAGLNILSVLGRISP